MVLNLRGRLQEWNRPAVMGIMNLTGDSFHAPSRVPATEVAARAAQMLAQGCDILDLGACSTRPGARSVDAAREADTLVAAVQAIRRALGPAPVVSVDTFRAEVAEAAVNAGADIVNDISGGSLDPEMFPTVARLKVPYVLTHMRGTPADMQTRTDYADVAADVLRDLAFKADALRQLGVADVIADPGFGFAKTLDQNYALLAALAAFRALGCPLLVGISRKSMICRELGIEPDKALNGTTALNMAALLGGADLLRVHDVPEAVQTVRLFQALKRNTPAGRHVISTLENRTL